MNAFELKAGDKFILLNFDGTVREGREQARVFTLAKYNVLREEMVVETIRNGEQLTISTHDSVLKLIV